MTKQLQSVPKLHILRLMATGQSTKSKGDSGETMAVEFLLKKSYKLLERNYRTKTGEVDIVMEDHGIIVFVEVKTRKYLGQGLPEEAVTPRKLSNIKRVGEHYLITKNFTSKTARIDVVAIELTTAPPTIRHLINVTG